MKVIVNVTHILNAMNLADKFHADVCKRIEEIQNEGLEVEVQYQQSVDMISALILGRKEKGGE